MTSAGSADLAFAKESSFKGSLVDADSDGNTDYWAFGRNETVTELSLSNALARLRQTGGIEGAESVAQALEGAFTVEATMSADVHSDVHDIIFNDGGTGFTTGVAASARVFSGIDYLSGTAERELIGCVPLEYSVDYTEGDMVRYTLTMAYADEEENTSITPSSITQPSGGSEVPFHGADLDVDTADQTKLQSATLSISGISRFQRGAQRTPIDAVVGAVEETLDASAIFTETSQLELAYGSSGSTSTQDQVGGVSATLTLSAGGTTVATYNLSGVTPNDYAWSDLVAADADLTEDVSYQVNGVSVA